MITLDSFKLLKKLSVTNIRLEPKQVKGTYCVEKFSGEITNFELIYSYEHPYFNKNNAADINLASMMLSQVALNYGLFFETIEFDGLFDKTDQRFLTDMMENTSREILTNKLLTKNDFIKAPFSELKPEKRDRYTQSKLIFTNSQFQLEKLEHEVKESDQNKYAILSSGGKDSLLTYGIIKEIAQPYPIFINEAGRHWFSAVNTNRYLKSNRTKYRKALVQ